MVIDILIISLVGALLSLDRTAFLQCMIAQPIITAPIIGFFLGDMYTGLKIGAAIQLLWVSALPVGSYIPPDENLAAILITSCTVLGMRDFQYYNVNSFIVLNILVLIPLAYIGSIIDVWIRNINATFSHMADQECENGELNKVERKNMIGLMNFYLLEFAVIFILLSISTNLLTYFYKLVPIAVLSTLHVMYPLMIIVGIATLLFRNKTKNSLVIFSGSFLIFSILLDFFK
jgi:mannose/fructose/N-acetylgalactosamine-specific phosphotransferase system component IIC